MTTIITLCTGNAARSVMAGALITRADPTLTVITAGTHVIDGQPVSWRTREALATVDAEAALHRSAQLRPGDLATADLVLAMASEHVSYMRRQHPEVAAKTATLKRLVRDLAPGPPALGERLAALGLAEVDAAGEEDIVDPAGGNAEDYVACAREIDTLVSRLLPLL